MYIRKRKIKELVLILIILSILTSAFFYKLVFSDQVLVAADILGQYLPWKLNYVYPDRARNPNLADALDFAYPMRYYASEMLKKKILPLWDTTIMCGTPFLANNESGLFNPFYGLFNIFSIPKAFGYISMLQVLLAGLFMYLFMRGIDVQPFGSFIASLTYMFNGFFIIWMWHLGIISVALWLPLILLFIEKFLRTKKFIYSLLAGILLGIQFLCGFIQLSLYIIIGTLLYTLIRIIQLKPKAILNYLLGIFLVFVIGFGLGAIQLIPTFELVGLCQRGTYPYSFSRLFDLSSALHLMTFIFPNLFGNPMNYNYWGTPNYSELYGYLGILPLILAFIALLYRKDKRTFVIFIIGAFALAVYIDTPLNGLLSISIPGYVKGIAPNRIVFLYLFSGAALAGLGADYLAYNKQLKSKLGNLIRGIAIALSIIVVFILFSILALRIWGESIPGLIALIPFCAASDTLLYFQDIFTKIHLISVRTICHLVTQAMLLPVVFIFASIWLLRFYLKKGSSFIFKAIATLIIITDLFYFGMRYLMFADKKMVFPKLETVEFLKKEKDLYRVLTLGNVFPKNTLIPYDIQTVEGYYAFPLQRYAELCLFMDETSKIGIGIGTEFSPSVISSPLVNILNVKYILSDKKIEQQRFKLIYDKDILIYENKNVLPRAFIVSKVKVIRDKEEILKELNSDSFNPREDVILEERPQIELKLSSAQDSTVRIIGYSPNIVKLEANLSAAGFLVLSDTYYPGWKVYVDDKEGRIYLANYAFRAVYLDKGQHTVRFIYRPLSFKIGLYLSISTLVIALIGIILLMRKIA